MKIRKMKKDDIVQCAIILRGSYSQHPYSENLSQSDAKKYIAMKFDSCVESSYVAISENLVVGFIFWQLSHWSGGKQAVLEEVVIDCKFQGKGIGTNLMQESENYLINLGVKSSMLWCIDDNRVVSFHKKNGFNVADNHIVMFKDY